jgi:hypothetical protein
MGKYGNSKLHDWYSDWHYNIIDDPDLTDEFFGKLGELYLCDKDRTFVEIDFRIKGGVIGIFDLKYNDGKDSVTSTEERLYLDELALARRVFIIWIDDENKIFAVQEVITSDGYELKYTDKNILSEVEYIRWLINLRENTVKKSRNFKINRLVNYIKSNYHPHQIKEIKNSL